MFHHILARFRPEISADEKSRMLPEIRELFNGTLALPGITEVSVFPNCVDRENRYDLMIRIRMERSALESYDACEWHHRWKEKYGPLLEKKAIFDCEEE